MVTVKDIFVATTITLIWVFLITVAAFPELLEDFGKLQRQFDLQIAKVIVLVVLVYLFDIFTKIVTTPLSNVGITYAVILLIFIMLNLSVLYIAMIFSINSIYAIFFVSLIMGLIKLVSVLQILKIRNDNESIRLIQI